MRARFTTDEIAAAALTIVDEAGVSALSMRALATALGTGPMTMYNYVPDKAGLEELVVAAVVAEVAMPEPTDDWLEDVYAVAEAMWRGIRAHPAAIPLVLTRRTSSATGFAAAEAIIAALGRGRLNDSDRLAAFHAVLAFVVGAAQAELAGPLTRGRDPGDAAARIGSVAGATYPNVEALSHVAMRTSVEDDFERGHAHAARRDRRARRRRLIHRVAARVFLTAVGIGQLANVFGQHTGGDVGQAGLFEHRSHAGAQRAPHVGQRRGRTGVRQVAEPDVADAGERTVDAAQHVGDADVGGGPGQLVSAFAATTAAHQPVVAQHGEDVDEELRRDALGRGQIVGLDYRTFVGGRQLDHRADSVLSFGRHAHCGDSAIRLQGASATAASTASASSGRQTTRSGRSGSRLL